MNWMVLVAEAREVTANTSNAKDAIFFSLMHAMTL